MVFERSRKPRYHIGMNRLKELMEKNNINATALASRVGARQPEISRLANYPSGKSSRRMTLDWALRLAPELGVEAKDLLPQLGDEVEAKRLPDGSRGMSKDGEKRVLENNSIKPTNDLDLTIPELRSRIEVEKLPTINPADRPILISVRGVTSAGVWFEHEQMIDEEPEPIPSIPGKYLHLEQFAFRVSGPSMNKKRIHNGDYIICVPYFDARVSPETGDIVVVERKQGHLIERSCKQLVVVGGGYELWPRSTDPRFQDPIRVKRCHDPAADDGIEIEIKGLVIAVHIPLSR